LLYLFLSHLVIFNTLSFVAYFVHLLFFRINHNYLIFKINYLYNKIVIFRKNVLYLYKHYSKILWHVIQLLQCLEHLKYILPTLIIYIYILQMTASKSKWFVGSSNNNISGSTNNALANDTLIRHPPDKFLVIVFYASWSKPRPFLFLKIITI